MTNELFPSNEQEMNEQDEVLREENKNDMNEKTISQEEFNDLVRERARHSKYSCCQTAWFSAKSNVEKDLKEKGIEVKPS